MPKRDEKGFIHYSPDELDQIPPYEARTGARRPGATSATGTTMGTFDGTIFGGAGDVSEFRPTQLTPSQVIGVTPRPPAAPGAGIGNRTGGVGPALGATLGGEVGADMEDFHWSTWSEEHSF